MENKTNTINPTESVSDFSFKDLFKLCLRKWLWFLICLVASVGIALFYIYQQQPKYNRYEQILVADQDSNGGIGDVSNAFATLGLFSKNTNVNNELITLKSPAVLYAVADSLKLYMNYFVKDGLRLKTLYGNSVPYEIVMTEIERQAGGSFRLRVNNDGSMEAFKFQRYIGDEKVKYKDKIKIPAGATQFDSPFGIITITPNPKYNGAIKEDNYELRISKMSMQGTVEMYSNMLKGDLVDQDADVIELSINDVSVPRAVDILNYVLLVYNQNYIEDKNKMAKATSIFINDRLNVIEAELGHVDKSIADYIKKTGNPDMINSMRVAVEQGSKIEQDIMTVNNQLNLSQYMLDYLKNEENKNALLPVNLGLDSREISEQIFTYNELLLNRNNIVNNSSPSNPLVENYDRQLEQMHNIIQRSIENQVNNLKLSLAELQKEEAKTYSYLANSPEVNLPLLSEERQQMVKQSLYLFLLQKREENELTQKFAADNVKIITPPVGSLSPISPKKGLIIAIAIILGIGIPFVLIYFLETMDTTVRDKKDLDVLGLPFAGEIPQIGKKQKLKVDKAKFFAKKKAEKPPLAVVEEGKRDVVNEAFRVVRGNIDFMTGKSADSRVILLTSFNPGSGKSFIAYNLGLSFSIKNKKVLIIDCDLRHGSSSMYVGMPRKGLANYLSGGTNDWNSLVVKTTVNPNLSILPIGTMPPNPAELLENGRIGELIAEAKKEYDIIFLDCPPVNIVVDTHLVSEWADNTLFVVRAGLLERKALSELNELYQEKKFKNMSVILNGTEAVHSRYYSYGNYQNLN